MKLWKRTDYPEYQNYSAIKDGGSGDVLGFVDWDNSPSFRMDGFANIIAAALKQSIISFYGEQLFVAIKFAGEDSVPLLTPITREVVDKMISFIDYVEVSKLGVTINVKRLTDNVPLFTVKEKK